MGATPCRFDSDLGHHHPFVANPFQPKYLGFTPSLPVGGCVLGVHFNRDGATGTVTLLVDGSSVGSIEVPFVVRMLGSAGMDIGRDAYSPVSELYQGPFPFEGRLDEVVIHLPERGTSLEDAVVAMRTEMGTE